MATPEQNALLALQLFGAPAAQYNAQNDARTNLSFKIAAMQREEQLRRDLADQQTQREDARNKTTLEWHRLQGEQRLKSDDARATDSERKQRAALEARDKADIQNEFDRDYPKYVDAMEAAKRPVRKREEFQGTRAGLGQMQAEAASAGRAYQDNRLKDAATIGAQRIQRLQTALKTAVERETELSKPTPEDEKIARAQATATIKKAITNDINRDYESLTPAQKKKGLAAIAAGDLVVATDHLGAEVVNAYDALFAQTLAALPGMKARMQEKALAARQRQEIQSVYEKADAAYSGAAGTNPFIGEQLEKLTPLQAIQTTPAVAPKSDEEKLRAKVPPRGSTTTPPAAPKTSASATSSSPLNMMAMMGGGLGGGGSPRTPLAVPLNIPEGSDVPTARPPAPILNIPEGDADSYPSFAGTSGRSITDKLLRRPLDRNFNSYENIYKGDVPEAAQNRRLQALMQILHGGEYRNPQERAVARSQIYQLLGVTPGGN